MGFLKQSDEYEANVASLLQRMTLEEKIGQMIYINFGYQEPLDAIREGQVGLIANVAGAERMNRLQRIAVEESRLGIPILFGNDVLHGYHTIFPIPLAEACSWDPELYRMTAALAAEEASLEGTQLIFAPMVDVTREPRWGRIAESPGEDPYLAAIYAAAKVEGFQSGVWEDRASMAACVKHFVAYGAVEGGRDYNATDVSDQLLANLYLPPFRSAVDAGVHMVMTSFNDYNGVPVTANAHLQRSVLRNNLGFDGVIIGDDKTIAKLIPQGLAANAEEACEKAVLAGADMDMNSGIYQQHLAALVRQGRVPEELIDWAAFRVLRLKFKLGLFERPFAPSRGKFVSRDVAREAARTAAGKSIVLLKNEGKTLPLERSISSIAVIGPLAKEPALGCWSCYGKMEEAVTVYDGIKAQAGRETRVLYAQGCDVTGDGREGFTEAVAIARESDLAILVIGENAAMSGEGMCRASLSLPGVQEALAQEICETGTPVVVVLMNGRPLVFEEIAERVPAIVEAWFLGSEAGHAVADVLFGRINPSGKLTVTFPRGVGQIPIYYYQKRSGRPDAEGKHFATRYLDLMTSPRYPFGYGLSYTEFIYREIEVLPKQLTRDETLEIWVEIENAGDRMGEEIVQLYIQDVAASITRPVKELMGFQRLSLAAGERRRVLFRLEGEKLGFYNGALQRIVEPGRFRVWVGPNSVEGLEGGFDLVERHLR